MTTPTDIQKDPPWFWGEGWLPFGLFAIGGATLIFVLHSIWPDANWQITIVACLLMLLFGYTEWRYGEKFQLGQEDRLGDNFYYLGLTYTLTSIAHALYIFSSVDKIDRLVSDFSVALLTTLLGVVVRVLLYEKHSDRKDLPDASDSVRKLSVELAETVGNLVEFRRQMINTLSLLADDASQKVNAAFTEFSSTAQQLEQTAKGMGASLRKGSGGFEKSFQRLSDASQTLGDKTSSLNEHMQHLENASSSLHRNATGIEETVKAHLKSVNDLTDAQRSKLNQLGVEITALSGPVTGLTNSLVKFKSEAEVSADVFSRLRNSLEPNSLKATLGSTTEAAAALQKTLLAVKQLFEEYERTNFSRSGIGQPELDPFQNAQSTEGSHREPEAQASSARTGVNGGVDVERGDSTLRTAAGNASGSDGSRTKWNIRPDDRSFEQGTIVREPTSSMEPVGGEPSAADGRKRWWRPFS